MKTKVLFFSYTIIIIAIILFGYSQIGKTYYLNDEWEFLGGVYTDGVLQYVNNFTVLQLLSGQGRLLGTLVSNIFMFIFPLNPWPFAITAFFFHTANAFLLFFLVKKITGSLRIAFLSGIFFASFSSYHQAIDWISCMVEIPISSFFLLLSLSVFQWYTVKKKNELFILSLFLAYLSFLFKEAALYIFLLLPVCYVIFSKKSHIIISLKEAVKKFWLAIVGIMGFVAIRYISPDVTATTAKLSLDLYTVLHSLFNMVFYPYIALTQVVVPARFMFRLARFFGEFEYFYVLSSVKNFGALYENIVSDMVCVGVSGIILLLCTVVYLLHKKQRKVIVFSFVLLFCSLTTAAFYLFERGSSYIESRYLYVPAMSVAMLFAVCVDFLLDFAKRHIRLRIVNNIIAIGVLICCTVFCMKEVQVTRNEVNISVRFGQDIKRVITQLLTLYPQLPKKPILLFTGDRDYFGHPDHPVPFQLGTGYMLMLVYYKTGVIPKSLISEMFLNKFSEQGYRTFEDGGFGFFADKKQLFRELEADKTIDPGQVVGLFFESSSEKLFDISPQIRNELIEQRNSL